MDLRPERWALRFCLKQVVGPRFDTGATTRSREIGGREGRVGRVVFKVCGQATWNPYVAHVDEWLEEAAEPDDETDSWVARTLTVICHSPGCQDGAGAVRGVEGGEPGGEPGEAGAHPRHLCLCLSSEKHQSYDEDGSIQLSSVPEEATWQSDRCFWWVALRQPRIPRRRMH